MSGLSLQTLHPSSGKALLSDRYEYVMHGKIFKYRNVQQGGQQRVEVTISFGGLLLQVGLTVCLSSAFDYVQNQHQ